MDQLSCRGLARGHHPIQCLTLLDGQGHFVFLHRGTPSQSPKSSHRLKESRSHVTCQSKMDGTLVGLTALSVEIITKASTLARSASSTRVRVPKMLFLIASPGLISIIGTCLCAAAWNTTP